MGAGAIGNCTLDSQNTFHLILNIVLAMITKEDRGFVQVNLLTEPAQNVSSALFVTLVLCPHPRRFEHLQTEASFFRTR
jgi:hypothetical protein